MKPNHYNPSVWSYLLDGGWEILAGKTDQDNDLLSLKTAKAEDWWFHVKGQPGSHIILRGPKGEKVDQGMIRQAAAVAAWHSKARKGGRVTINYTQAKHVSKPRGAKPGLVQIKREKCIKVEPAVPLPEANE